MHNAQFQSIALYVDQPITNSNKPIDDRSGPAQKIIVGPGHTWISITQIINGQNITLNVGLYPSTSIKSLLSQPTSGAFNNDTEHEYDVFVRWENPPDATFDQLIINLKTYTSAPNYDLDDFNCSTWAVNELEKIGYNVPKTIVNFGGAYLLKAVAVLLMQKNTVLGLTLLLVGCLIGTWLAWPYFWGNLNTKMILFDWGILAILGYNHLFWKQKN